LAIAPIHFWGGLRTHHLMTLQLLPNLGAVFLMLLCGALAEELVFRGYPFQHLETAIGSIQAVVVISFLYGLLHLLNPYPARWGIVNSFLIGVLLSFAYLRTRALWLPWGFHFAWNATLGLLFGLPVSGIRVLNLWTYTDAFGSDWLTGGKYGVEASASVTAVILLGMLFVWKLPLATLQQPARKTPSTTPVHDPVSSVRS
jgi:uncharacterized protein